MAYTMLLNVAQIDADLPCEIAPGHFIDRATNEQIVELRKLVSRYLAWDGLPLIDMLSPYEMRQDGNRIVPLAPRDYRYFVLNFVGNNQVEVSLKEACLLLPSSAEMILGFNLMFDSDFVAMGMSDIRSKNPSVSSISLDMHAFFATQFPYPGENFLRITADDLKELGAIYKQLEAHDKGVLALQPIIRDLGVLKVMDPRSRLQFTGYMGVIESLLTHAPRENDPHATISRQLKSKMALLENRTLGGFDYASLRPHIKPGKTMSDEKILGELYAMRSAIAHGSDLASNPGDIEYQAALQFLRETAKKVIKCALAEPELIRDLRQC